MSATAAPVVSKSDFARMAGVSAARVSQYISLGKIGPEAIVGQGREARIRVDVAMRQLHQRLDVGQRMANGLGTRIDVPTAADEPPPQPIAAAAPVAPRPPTIEDRLKAEKLWRAEADRRSRERQERAEAGLYTRTEDASREQKKLARELLEAVQGGLDGMARAIAARFELPTRDVLHAMNSEFRRLRSEIASGRRATAAALPEFVEEPLGEAEPPTEIPGEMPAGRPGYLAVADRSAEGHGLFAAGDDESDDEDEDADEDGD